MECVDTGAKGEAKSEAKWLFRDGDPLIEIHYPRPQCNDAYSQIRTTAGRTTVTLRHGPSYKGSLQWNDRV